MHDVDAKPGMSNEHFLETEWAVQAGAVTIETQIGRSHRSSADVDADGDVELFRQRPVRGE
jgi:hypothetical protein